eukprot:TRINITY_DN7868_c0_g1_i1.p1 TRINITY_DN7868_c0_g1~~TRINITY_DN7868_c0_g1_i1.p1  ORF type:complete len:335 (-),score=98.75 TRINITY_DN7868_c0_g1_i1:6-869(-)
MAEEYGSEVTAEEYQVTAEQRAAFERDGFVHLPAVLTHREVDSLVPVYERFMRQEIAVTGKDFCDMAGTFDRKPEDFSVANVMLPRKYYPEWQGNVYERRTASIARQLTGEDTMAIDYDQLLAKHPERPDSQFYWHQDMAYWPPFTSRTTTTTCWLAIDDSTLENGCMRFVPGTHKEPEVRPHRPAGGSDGRAKAHALVTELREGDEVRYVPIGKGDITVHNERVVHGSGPNTSTDSWRRAYIVAYRLQECIDEERRIGFDHSHNSEVNWDTWGMAGNPHFLASRRS